MILILAAIKDPHLPRPPSARATGEWPGWPRNPACRPTRKLPFLPRLRQRPLSLHDRPPSDYRGPDRPDGSASRARPALAPPRGAAAGQRNRGPSSCCRCSASDWRKSARPPRECLTCGNIGTSDTCDICSPIRAGPPPAQIAWFEDVRRSLRAMDTGWRLSGAATMFLGAPPCPALRRYSGVGRSLRIPPRTPALERGNGPRNSLSPCPPRSDASTHSPALIAAANCPGSPYLRLGPGAVSRGRRSSIYLDDGTITAALNARKAFLNRSGPPIPGCVCPKIPPSGGESYAMSARHTRVRTAPQNAVPRATGAENLPKRPPGAVQAAGLSLLKTIPHFYSRFPAEPHAWFPMHETTPCRTNSRWPGSCGAFPSRKASKASFVLGLCTELPGSAGSSMTRTPSCGLIPAWNSPDDPHPVPGMAVLLDRLEAHLGHVVRTCPSNGSRAFHPGIERPVTAGRSPR